MKAKFTTRMLPFVVFTSVLIASCSKDTDTFQNTGDGNSLKIMTVDQVVGNIVDLGIVSGNVHHMLVTFINGSNVYDSGTGELKGTASDLSVSFFTEDDGQLPTGKYLYSESDEIFPFTFKSQGALFKFNDSDNVPSTQFLSLTDGVIDLNKDGDQYTVMLSLRLQSGDRVDGSASGKMNYYDVQQ